MSNLLRLAQDALIYGLGGVVGRFIWIFLVPILTRALRPSDYGILDLISTVVAFALVILMFGMDSAIGYYFFKTNREQERRKMIFTATSFLVLTGIIGAVVLIFLAPFLTSFFLGDQSSVLTMMRLAFVSLPFTLLSGFILNILRLRFERWRYLTLAVSQIILGAAAMLFAVFLLRGGLLSIYQTSLVAAFIFAGASVIVAGKIWNPQIDLGQLRLFLRFGLPLIPAGLALTTLALIDRFFLVRYTDLTQLGLYSIGNQVANSVLLLVSGFQLAWGPFAFSVAKTGKSEGLYVKTLHYYLIVLGGIALVVSLFAKEVLQLFTTESYIAAYRVVPYLAFGLVAYGAYYIVSIGSNLARKTEYITFSTLFAAIINIMLNMVLIPRYGMDGAAVATLVAYISSTAMLYYLSQRVYPFNYRAGASLLLFFIPLGLAIAGSGIKSFGVLPAALLKCGVLFIFVAIMLTNGSISRSEISVVFRQNLKDSILRRNHG